MRKSLGRPFELSSGKRSSESRKPSQSKSLFNNEPTIMQKQANIEKTPITSRRKGRWNIRKQICQQTPECEIQHQTSVKNKDEQQSQFSRAIKQKTRRIHISSEDSSSYYQYTKSKSLSVQSSLQKEQSKRISQKSQIQIQVQYEADSISSSKTYTFQSYHYSKISSENSLVSQNFPLQLVAEIELMQTSQKHFFEVDRKWFEYKQEMFEGYKQLQKLRRQQSQKLEQQQKQHEMLIKSMSQLETSFDIVMARFEKLLFDKREEQYPDITDP